MDKTKKLRGRPKIATPNRKRNNVTIRMRDALKATLEETAAANQRSVSEEIEHQLEERALLRNIMPTFGRPDLFWVGHMLANAISFIEKKTGKAWDEDPETTQECVKAVITAMSNVARVKAGADAVTLDKSLGSTIGKFAVEDFVAYQKTRKDKENQS
jgi:hypothetical protein